MKNARQLLEEFTALRSETPRRRLRCSPRTGLLKCPIWRASVYRDVMKGGRRSKVSFDSSEGCTRTWTFETSRF
jgi:hypothetical protein